MSTFRSDHTTIVRTSAFHRLFGADAPQRHQSLRGGVALFLLSLPLGCATTKPVSGTHLRPKAAVETYDTAVANESVVRGQNGYAPTDDWFLQQAPGARGHFRQPMTASRPPDTGNSASGEGTRLAQNNVPSNRNSLWPQPAQGSSATAADLWNYPSSSGSAASQPATQPVPQSPPAQVPPYNSLPGPTYSPANDNIVPPPPTTYVPPASEFLPPSELPAYPDPLAPTTGPGFFEQPPRYADLIVNAQETQTGTIMLGAGVNSDAGLTGQIVISERNFDWRRFPTSLDDIMNGTAWRGNAESFRVEALPGSVLQRYLVQWTQPYLAGSRVSLSLSGYLFDRRYFDWDEQRLGGRAALGYRLTPDLSISAGVRGEGVNITNPRVSGVQEIEQVLGKTDLYIGNVSLTHDTRDVPFAPTEGHYVEMTYEQGFGSSDYPRGITDLRRYLLLKERADGSGRHVLGYSLRLGFSGSQTPVYENFFAGGHSTMRGFDFRGASPTDNGAIVGGEFMMLGALEYLFPITADDMLKGVAFVDYGTIEEEIEINRDDFRVSLGLGLRIFIPMMGPAPIALDFAVPVAREDTDRIQNFSFFVGFGR